MNQLLLTLNNCLTIIFQQDSKIQEILGTLRFEPILIVIKLIPNKIIKSWNISPFCANSMLLSCEMIFYLLIFYFEYQLIKINCSIL